jgi:Ca-activated chloride channel family protein
MGTKAYPRALLASLALALVIFLESAAALADGIMIPPPDIPLRDAFAIRFHRVTVDINGGVARTEIDQEFENLTGRRIEADYVFPIPQGAALENFAIWVGGDKVTGAVLPAGEARSIYEGIVRAQRDPALLEYVGNDAFRARIFPIEPGERKRVQLSYTQVLRADSGLYEYVYPLNTEKFSAQLIGDVAVSGKIESTVPIKTVYSPSHAISVNRKDDLHSTFSYEETNVRPAVDFVLYYSVDDREIGASLLAYDADDSEDGFFLATLTPRVAAAGRKTIAKDFIFVLDKSGSMSDDNKISQAKEALRFVLRNLNEGDRFNVIAYSDELWECFSGGLRDYTGPARDEALAFVDQFDAAGGTNINEALLRAFGMLSGESSERPEYVVFLTDGLPTVGITDEAEIERNATGANKRSARLFAFGVGYDVNTHLLDKLSEGNHGVTEYVRPNESIEVKVSSFYAKISSPVLTGVKLGIHGANISELYPREMPDLFKGEQVVLAGRYAPGSGGATIVLTGQVDGETKVFSYPVNFASRGSYNFVPRVWASRKIGFLTDEIRLHGMNDELVGEIVRLSKRYGIITEYTSFLIREDDMLFAPEEAQAEMLRDAGTHLAEAKSGAAGVGQAQTSQRLKGQVAGGQGAANAPAAYYDAAGEEVQVQTVQYAGDLTFFNADGYWTDSRYDPDKQKLIEVKAFSDAYFALLADGGPLGKLLSQGDQVIVVLDEKSALKVSADTGQETMDASEVEHIQQLVAQAPDAHLVVAAAKPQHLSLWARCWAAVVAWLA